MATKSFVAPAEGKENLAGVIMHPADGALMVEGCWWTDDHFTFTLLRDGAIKVLDPKKTEVKDASPDAVFAKGRKG